MRRVRALLLRRGLVVVTAAVLLVGLGVGTWLVAVRSDERSPEATVQAFFEARRERDCERLVDLVSLSSWPGAADLSRAERLDQCHAAVVAEQRAPDGIDLVAEDGNVATVEMSLPVDSDQFGRINRPGIVVVEPGGEDDDEGPTVVTRAYAEGNLVREHGTWRVRLDHAFLRFGRSPEEVVAGSVEAFREGDCERLVRYVSDAAWAVDGGPTRDEHLDRCSASVAAREGANEDLSDEDLSGFIDGLAADLVEVTPTGDGRATAAIRWATGPRETVPLRLDRGTWKLGAPLGETGLLELASFLAPSVDGGAFSAGMPQLVRPDGAETDFRDLPEGDDAPERRREHGFVRGVWAPYEGPEGNSLDVLLFEFTDPAGALAYGELLATRAEHASYVDPPTSLPSVAERRAAIAACGGAELRDCTLASNTVALGTQGRFLVGVNLVDYDGTDAPAAEALARTEAILQAELDGLP